MDNLTLIKHHLNLQGQIIRRPSKPALKQAALEYCASKIIVWSYTESEINAILNQRHTFGDVALLRRELYINHYIDRTIDGRTYRKI